MLCLLHQLTVTTLFFCNVATKADACRNLRTFGAHKFKIASHERDFQSQISDWRDQNSAYYFQTIKKASDIAQKLEYAVGLSFNRRQSFANLDSDFIDHVLLRIVPRGPFIVYADLCRLELDSFILLLSQLAKLYQRYLIN